MKAFIAIFILLNGFVWSGVAEARQLQPWFGETDLKAWVLFSPTGVVDALSCTDDALSPYSRMVLTGGTGGKVQKKDANKRRGSGGSKKGKNKTPSSSSESSLCPSYEPDCRDSSGSQSFETFGSGGGPGGAGQSYSRRGSGGMPFFTGGFY